MKTCYVYTVMLWKSKWDWQNITNGEFINTATMHLNVITKINGLKLRLLAVK